MSFTTKQRIVLILALLSYFLTALSSSVVITGLAKISNDMHLNQLTLSWVQNAYGLAFGSFILLSDKLSDFFGRRRILNIALIIFAIGSFISGFTISTPVMIISRFITGAGAAIMAPTSMALLMDYFEGPDLVKAIAWYSSISGLGASVGLVLGGLLASFWTWRVGFYLNVPVAVVMIILSIRTLDNVPSKKGNFDILGTLLSVFGAGTLVYAVNGAPNFVLFLAIAIFILGIFVATERKAVAPIMPLTIFANRNRVLAYIIRAMLVGSMMGFWFFISEYLQKVLHFTPLKTGFGFLPMTLTLFITAILVPRLVDIIGNKITLLLANVALFVGFVWIVIFADNGYFLTVLLPMVLFGIGQGLGLTPLTNLGIAHVSVENAGVASGLVNTAHQLGSVLGLAIMVNISLTFTNGQNMANEFKIAMIVGLVLTIIYSLLSITVKKEED